MEATKMRRLLKQARIARLATIGPSGRPHLVPICFALRGDTIFFAVDLKPKRGRDLQRIRNLEVRPAVTVLVDHYAEDWRRLWWVRVDGPARVLPEGGEASRAIDLLAARYRQYVKARPPGPVVAITIEKISGWSAT